MEKVYCIFFTQDGGDGYTEFMLLGCCASLKTAQHFIKGAAFMANEVTNCNPLLNSMKKENNWTHIGKRDDCPEMCCLHSDFCGYILEEVELIFIEI